jgi:hypothetical protein
MLTKIDWLSFSIPMDVSRMEEERDAPQEIVASLDRLHADLPQWLSLSDEFEAGNGRKPYSNSWVRADHGMVIFSHPRLSHALVEVSGRGCDRLEASGFIRSVLDATQQRMTRIDIACDIRTTVRPKDFAEERNVGRFKAISYVNSESGETFYVGAKTSDRYSRVYRYNPPHERSALLRVEYVIKAENAKNMARTLLEQSIGSVVSALGETFGWTHPAWAVTDAAAELEVYRPDRREGKTLYWLADTIAPLLARLHREGVIDAETWLEQNVLTRIKR